MKNIFQLFCFDDSLPSVTVRFAALEVLRELVGLAVRIIFVASKGQLFFLTPSSIERVVRQHLIHMNKRIYFV